MSDNNSASQAKAKLESIVEMVAALNVDYDRLEELREILLGAYNDQGEDQGEDWVTQDADSDLFIGWLKENADDEEKGELLELMTAAGGCTDREDAERTLWDDPLSVQVRSDWYSPGASNVEPAEFEILLCTGGPACRIIGALDGGQPTTAQIEHQDWGTPWTNYPLTSEEEETVLQYCGQFYLGE